MNICVVLLERTQQSTELPTRQIWSVRFSRQEEFLHLLPAHLSMWKGDLWQICEQIAGYDFSNVLEKWGWGKTKLKFWKAFQFGYRIAVNSVKYQEQSYGGNQWYYSDIIYMSKLFFFFFHLLIGPVPVLDDDTYNHHFSKYVLRTTLARHDNHYLPFVVALWCCAWKRTIIDSSEVHPSCSFCSDGLFVVCYIRLYYCYCQIVILPG